MIRQIGRAALVWASLAGGAVAHPHIFIDTGVEVIFDDQVSATALRITWTYDDLFSLIIIEDRGLDPDFDGVLTADETAALQGWDMQWDPGFAGDTYALRGDVALALSGPSEWTAGYVDGRLTSTHLRRFAEPVPMDQSLVVQSYDPGFYSAYTVEPEVRLTGGEGCSAQVFEPDRKAADARLQAAIAEQAGTEDLEGAFPAIGAAYAEEVRITCAAPS